MSQISWDQNVKPYRDMQEREPSERVTKGVLPLSACSLAVDAKGGLARVTLVQRFDNPHAEPLSVTYLLPLPEDAAVSDFGFTVGTRVVRGVVQKKAEARETYERALADGRSGALLEQERASLFTQEIGNIPPGEHVEVRITLDQPLVWLADASTEGSWEWRFPLAAAPRYLGGPTLGAESPHFSTGPTAARASLALHVRDSLQASPESPTHPLSHAVAGSLAGTETTFGNGNRIALDRDVAIRWSVATASFTTTLDARGEATRAFGLLTVVPPARSARPRTIPRDLTLLLDTSGSMQGEPLEQEKRMALALIEALGDDDTLEVIEFSSRTRAFKRKPVPATSALKREATTWVQALAASGGTEMVSGIEAAMRELRAESQRQIVLITDGLVGFERQIVGAVLQKLPAGARLHAVGVGSAVNRSLVAPIARAGRGIEAIVGLGEDAERAAARVLARTSAPLAVDLHVEGPGLLQVVPSRLPDVFANAPLRLAVELAPGGGEIVVRGRTAEGPFVQRLVAPRTEAGEGNAALAKLFARELVEECEMQLSGGGSQTELDAEIERIGVDFQIASRLTSWVAVTTERTVDPRDPTRHVVQPQALAYGTSAEGLGLRASRNLSMAMFGAVRSAGAPPGLVARREASNLDTSPRTMGLGAPPPPPRPAPAPAAGRARAAMPAPAAPKGSLPSRAVEMVKRAFRGAPPAKAESRDEAAATPPSAFARIVRHDDGEVVVEFESSGFVLDTARCTCRLVLADGSILEGVLVEALSTRGGPIAAGLRIRLVFRHDSRHDRSIDHAQMLVALTGAADLEGRAIL